jgi:hypothetical protein
MHHTSRFGDVFLNTAEVIFETHTQLTQQPSYTPSAARRHFSAEDKICIILEGLRGEDSIAELCRREGIVQNLYYRWSKDFLERSVEDRQRLVGGGPFGWRGFDLAAAVGRRPLREQLVRGGDVDLAIAVKQEPARPLPIRHRRARHPAEARKSSPSGAGVIP